MPITHEVRALEDTGKVWVSDDIFDNGVSSLWVSVGDSVLQGIRRRTLHFRLQMALLLVKKALSISEQELQVTDLGPIDFAAAARALGARGVRVEDDAGFEPALRQALVADRPSVLHLVVDRRWEGVDSRP